MKIFYQESEYDCGISVTRSLIQHFLGQKISRTELFDQVNISPKGLSIFELEEINKRYGIHLESYRISIQELKNLKIRDFFVLLIYKDNLEHFVIAKKNKRGLTLYDSAAGKIKLNFQQLGSIFTEKILLIEKIEKPKDISPKRYLNDECLILQLPRLWRSTSFEIIVFIIVVLGFSIHKFIFEDVIQSHYWGNITIFIFLSCLLVIIWALGEYIKDIASLQDKQLYFKKLYSLFFDRIENKKNYFFSKLGKNQLLLIQQHIQNISLFYGEILSSFISGILISLALVFYLIYIQPWFSVIVMIAAAVKYLNFWVIKKWDSKNFNLILKNNLNIQKILFSLNNFAKKEWNFHKLISLNKSFKNEITQYQLTEKECTSKKIFYSRINFFITNLINVAIYIMSCYLHFQNNISLPNIVLSGMIYSQLSTSLDKVILGGINWEKCSESLQQFKHFIFNDNITQDNKLKINLPKKIQLKNLNYHNGIKEIFNNLSLEIYPDTFLIGSSGIGKSTLYRLISLKLPPTNSIFFDEILVSNISEKCFNNLVIYQNAQTESKEFNWEELIKCIDSDQRDTINSLTQEIEISIGQNPSNLSDGQRQFLNLLNLLKFSNKLLLLDEVTSHMNQEIKEKVYKEIFPILKSKNFVVCCDHDTNLKKFFKNYINLNAILQK